MIWIARTGSARRDPPDGSAKWSGLDRQFRRWTPAGPWEAVLKAVNEAVGRAEPSPDRLRMVDGTIVRAHPHAAGPGGSARQGVGRSRGGLATEVHLRIHAWGLAHRADVTPGQTSDHRGFDPAMGDDLPAPAALRGDEGHDGDRIRARVDARDEAPVMPMRRCPQGASGRRA